ncbi:sensor histidine kinase [Halorientalis sp.]|uniref:sensor histidine kinase n=1 Tax=Halorientalis sp. TaxID=1931229 RepID=UPI002603F94D|nr:HAMP domain-containing sensor histidine kinase [Halorientalis sp.]
MQSEPPDGRPADDPGVEMAPVRITSELSNTGNQRVLTDWIRSQERYEVVSTDHAGLPAADFDLGIFDERSLRDHGTEIRERKTDASAFLPVLLVGSDGADAPRDTPGTSETEPAVRRLVDEILPTPVDTAELQRRLDTLARIRAQSMALERKTEQLLLLNRITRHDIRNEMNVIRGWTELLPDDIDDADDRIPRRILNSTQHVVDLTDVAREFAETLQTAGDPDLQAVELDSVLTAELTKRRRAFEDAEFVVDSEIPRVDVRANDLLASVFRNLLNNAVQHNDSDTPRVAVAVGECDETVSVTIADNGPGIPPDMRDAVLGRTEQGLDHPGAGLGLYLVDTLTTQYGGALRIGEADSGGASIEVELPKEPQTDLKIVNDEF